jgi:hypothetical protein
VSAIFDTAIAYWRSVRADFELHRASQYERAELECRGVLLNRAAKAAGVDPWSLFIGPHERAHKWASDELLEFWTRNRRLTFAEYEQGVLDGGAFE